MVYLKFYFHILFSRQLSVWRSIVSLVIIVVSLRNIYLLNHIYNQFISMVHKKQQLLQQYTLTHLSYSLNLKMHSFPPIPLLLPEWRRVPPIHPPIVISFSSILPCGSISLFKQIDKVFFFYIFIDWSVFLICWRGDWVSGAFMAKVEGS